MITKTEADGNVTVAFTNTKFQIKRSEIIINADGSRQITTYEFNGTKTVVNMQTLPDGSVTSRFSDGNGSSSSTLVTVKEDGSLAQSVTDSTGKFTTIV